MRLEQSKKNITYSIITYLLKIILQFAVRLAFIKVLPVEYLGINGLFSNILAMLSLAELGVAPAIVYSLYKPLAENDIPTIKALMRLFQKAYRLIGVFIIVVGVCLVPWLDWFIKDNSIAELNYYYIIFLLNTGLSYFYAYKRNLITADQKQYINSIYQSYGQIALAVLQIISLCIFESYWIYIILMLVVTVSENYMAARKADELYPYLQESSAEVLDAGIKATIIKNVKAMIFHKIGGMVVLSSGNLILAKFVGLTAVGLYSNYVLVLNAMNTLVGQFFAALTASIGNMLALESDEKNVQIYKVAEFILAWQATVIICGLYVLFNDFIHLWVGEQFLFSKEIVLAIIINFYLQHMRRAVNTFKEAAGLYWNDRYKPIAESIINFSASVYLTIHYGVVGVVWGCIISTLLTCFWVEPYVLFCNSIKLKLKDYFYDYFKFTVVVVWTAVVTRNLYEKLFANITIVNFILGMVLCVVVSNIIWITVFRKREEMQYLREVARTKFGMRFL